MKWTFGQPERAAEALRPLLPEKLARGLSWPTLRVEPIPMVLHTGPRAWNAPVSFAESFGAVPELLGAAEPFVPDFRFVLDDLGRIPDEELRERAADALTRLVLLALRHGRKDLQHPTVLELGDLMVEVLRAPRGLDAIRQVLRYILEVGKDIDPEALAVDLGRLLGPDVEKVIMTTGERLREEGRPKERIAILLRLLQKKFGAAPEQVEPRVRAASPDRLEHWIDSVLTAESLEEVLAS